MPMSTNLNIESAQHPKWSLVVLLILTLAVETFGDLSGCIGPQPEYDACYVEAGWRTWALGTASATFHTRRSKNGHQEVARRYPVHRRCGNTSSLHHASNHHSGERLHLGMGSHQAFTLVQLHRWPLLRQGQAREGTMSLYMRGYHDKTEELQGATG